MKRKRQVSMSDSSFSFSPADSGIDWQARAEGKRLWILAGMVFLLLIGGNAGAIVVKMPLDRLVEEAEVITTGTVESVEDKRIGGLTFSYAKISLASILKGDLSLQQQTELTVKFFRGISTSAVFRAGEQVLLFLRKVENQDVYETVAELQGKRLIKDLMVFPDQVPVSEFVQRIREEMQNRR
jgi:hypothetical protein